MPQNTFFLRTRDLLVSQKTTQRHFFFHPPSPFHSNFCNCNSIGICTASRFKVQLPLLYTVWSNTYSEIGLEVRCNLSQLLAQKITKHIHSSKPALLNRPIDICVLLSFSLSFSVSVTLRRSFLCLCYLFLFESFEFCFQFLALLSFLHILISLRI